MIPLVAAELLLGGCSGTGEAMGSATPQRSIPAIERPAEAHRAVPAAVLAEPIRVRLPVEARLISSLMSRRIEIAGFSGGIRVPERTEQESTVAAGCTRREPPGPVVS